LKPQLDAIIRNIPETLTKHSRARFLPLGTGRPSEFWNEARKLAKRGTRTFVRKGESSCPSRKKENLVTSGLPFNKSLKSFGLFYPPLLIFRLLGIFSLIKCLQLIVCVYIFTLNSYILPYLHHFFQYIHLFFFKI
jgi:hypothetical protein